ncbi:MAG: hypothetical protein H7Y10_06390 [Flavobacterium sp.]|nr:hypothetical protein [Flavobacterium sp.]
MSDITVNGEKKSFKEKFKEEFIEYWVNVLYLSIYFGVFISYKRLILAHYDIDYEEYGIAFINAFILGKVVSVGGMMKLGTKMDSGPLVISTLFKSFVFTIWLAVFNVIEELISGYFKTDSLQGAIDSLSHHIKSYEYLGSLLVVFTCFIPFFAFKEMSRVLGHHTILELFFKRKETIL